MDPRRDLELELKAIELYNSGIPFQEVVKQVGRSKSYVERAIKRHPDKAQKRHRKFLRLDPTKDIVLQMRSMGRVQDILSTGCIEADTCLEGSGGYPTAFINGKNTRLNRAVLQQKGIDLLGLMACHRCHNRKCINPDHLYAGTAQQNSDDMVEVGRQVKGEKQWQARLTAKDVRKIRSLKKKGMSSIQIGRLYNVHSSTVRSVLRGATWKHVS